MANSKDKKNKWHDPKIGYVIEIPDSYTLLINVGQDKLSVGDTVTVYEEGPLVKDSMTGESIGRLDFTKYKLQVVETYENFSTCKNIIEEKVGSIYSMASIINGTTEKRATSLPISKEDVKNWKIKNKTILINDPVKKA